MSADEFRCICDLTVLFEPPNPTPLAVEGCPAHRLRRSIQQCCRFLEEVLSENPTPEEVEAAFDAWRERRRVEAGGVSSLDSPRTTP